jgi:ubiquinone/menaquinone biosynthesis C-methylase UbiE
MTPKPACLGSDRAAAFQHPSVAAAYPNRPPYPDETFTILAGLISDEPRAVLDVGCGTGDIARQLVNIVARVDAVDFSARMAEVGKRLPNGDDACLNWIISRVEDAPLNPPYALITAGESLHWLDWDVVLPRFARAITTHGYLATVKRNPLLTPWGDELSRIIPRYSTNPDYRPVDLIAELTSRGLFEQRGEARTAPLPFSQPLESYIEGFHSMSSFAREKMTPSAAAAFDAEVRQAVSPFVEDGRWSCRLLARWCGAGRWNLLFAKGLARAPGTCAKSSRCHCSRRGCARRPRYRRRWSGRGRLPAPPSLPAGF